MRYRFHIIATLLSFVTAIGLAQPDPNNLEWMQSIRADHPRLFLTSEDIPNIISNSQNEERGLFLSIQRSIDKLMNREIVFKNELAKSGEGNNIAQYGHRTAESALLWLITKDKRYFDFTKKMMLRMIEYYELRVANNLNIHWYSFSVTSVLCAYDWIYNDLSKEEREEIGKRLYSVTHNIAWHGKGVRKSRHRENPNPSPNTGLYGSSALPWFIGLTFYGEGIDDDECKRMVRDCYKVYCNMSAYRANLLGKSGGNSSGTVGYGLGHYPYAEYNLIYTFRSAMGIDLTPQMEYMIGYMHYMDWARLPGNREFGIGDSNHSDNKMPSKIPTHIKEIANLFGARHPDIIPWASNLLSLYNHKGAHASMPFMPLLHHLHIEKHNSYTPTPIDRNNQSRHFETLGQVIMRSGQGNNDTYAVFTTERKVVNHQHYDINNFIIYKNGYRALDSGTRPQPGIHLSHYYARTVAHNCITIRMPDEKMPKYWNSGPAKGENRKTPVPNDGGQRNFKVAKLLSHEENEHYVYIASDASKCYHEDKAELVVREFVWIKPDIFVIFDRVVSDDAEYPKRWLYHIASEPKKRGRTEFAEESQGGKSICRTLLPKRANIDFVGGPGKQFWSDGRNWPIPERNKKWIPKNDHPLVGQWRVEVSPKLAATHDHFLHIVQVGDETLKSLPKTKTKESDNEVTLSFEYQSKNYTLTFDKTKDYGCKIEVNKL